MQNKYVTYGDNVGSRVGLSVLMRSKRIVKVHKLLEYTSMEISQGCQVSFQLTAILLVKVMGSKSYDSAKSDKQKQCELGL